MYYEFVMSQVVEESLASHAFSLELSGQKTVLLLYFKTYSWKFACTVEKKL